MELYNDIIKKNCASQAYTRGMKLIRGHGVYHDNAEETEEGLFRISGEVEGSSGMDYHVWLEYDEKKEEILDYECECPAFYNYSGMCKHCVALALQYGTERKSKVLKDFEKLTFLNTQKKTGRITDLKLANLIQNLAGEGVSSFLEPEYEGIIELLPVLKKDYRGYCLSFFVGARHKYSVKDIGVFLNQIQRRERVEYGKKLAFIHDISVFTEEARELIEFLIRQLSVYRYYHGGAYSTILPAIKELFLPTEGLCEFFHLMSGKSFKYKDYMTNEGIISVLDGEPELAVTLEKSGDRDGFTLVWPPMESFSAGKRLYIRLENVVYECGKKFSKEMAQLTALGKAGSANLFFISEKDMRGFCSTLLPILKKHTTLELEGNVEEYLPIEAEIHIYIDTDWEGIKALAEAVYGDTVINLRKTSGVSDAYRDLEKEYKAVHMLKAYFTETEEGEFLIEEQDEDRIYYLLTTGVSQLHQVGEVYVSESFKRFRVAHPPQVTVGIGVKGGLLDLSVDSGGLTHQELEGYLESYRLKRRFFRLKNGDFIPLTDNSMSVVSELTEGLGLTSGQLTEAGVTVPRNKAFYLDQVLKDAREGTRVVRDMAFKSMIRNMKNVEDSDYELPKELEPVLRNYQKTGYRWMCTLHALGFGGILADDMGLGKTLQVIAFLLHYKQSAPEVRKASLIVCPASLVYNWESELEKFAPDLTVLTIAGQNIQRLQQIEICRDYDVCVTSYDLLKRDLEAYQKQEFFAEILDEAQNIKNHETQAAKAVKVISSEIRFAVTGTPIENRLSELWSIFDYLMPQMLGSYGKFKTEFESPIVQGQDEAVRKRLQRMIKPFIMRRMKVDVLRDLPDKEEIVVYSRLEGEQAGLYAANVQKMLDSLNKTSSEEFKNDKIQILAQLTRIRQICCAPSLVYKDYGGEAAKIDTCMELLREARESGHKVLIFSQFTSLFDLLEKEFKKNNLSCFRLDGSTPKSKRMEMASSFNTNKVPVFLISLKAGGTGLNLTGASIVIHFDPWWNIAAQNQATDRAYRIGQTENVTVYKLIAKNTIEEKILKLQEAKKELSDQVISEAGISVAGLTKEDFVDMFSGTS